MSNLIQPLVLCPDCGGGGWVFYVGTTSPTGDDPSAEIQCPSCKGKFLVQKAWSDGIREEPGMCTFCYKTTTVSDVWMGGSTARPYTEPVCYPCYERLGL